FLARSFPWNRLDPTGLPVGDAPVDLLCPGSLDLGRIDRLVVPETVEQLAGKLGTRTFRQAQRLLEQLLRLTRHDLKDNAVGFLRRVRTSGPRQGRGIIEVAIPRDAPTG